YVPYLVADQREKVRQFMDGLEGHYRAPVIRNVRNGSYSEVFDTALCSESYYEMEKINQENKRGTHRQGRHDDQGSQVIGGPLRFFAMARQDIEESNVVVIGIITINSHEVYSLIDPGSTYSYVSPSLDLFLERRIETLVVPYIIMTPMGETLSADRVYRDCVTSVQGKDTKVDLFVLPMTDFDVIIGMDWMVSCYAFVDCYPKLIHFDIPGETPFAWKGMTHVTQGKVIAYVKARQMINHGCLGFIATVHDTRVEDIIDDSVPIVQEFVDIFPDDLPELP
ncbi:uncharacterized protein LOC124895138, partial [Capsicum annuum]|uniref:uncharacterized protein LOC124895138 n=1 Tax=Capsicum annuum TaxID=4072 RepID=UPI001FB18E51